MSRTQKFISGVLLILIGAVLLVISSFSLKYDPAWLSVGFISVVSAAVGTRIIDNLNK